MKTNHFVNGLLDLSGILFATNVIVESIPKHSRNSNSSGPIHGSRFDRNKYSTSIYEGRNLCALSALLMIPTGVPSAHEKNIVDFFFRILKGGITT